MTTQNLTPAQKKVKRPRPVRYDGPNKNLNDFVARDIITLYLTCGLGYSPIRHILGLETDKKIEDVVRQHMLGRTKANGAEGELYCPPQKNLTQLSRSIINQLTVMYETYSDPYIIEMLDKGVWKDDPVYNSIKCVCGADLDPSWKLCPFCGDTSKLHK